MRRLLVREVRVIVVNPQAPARTFFKAALITQDRQPGIFYGSHPVEMLECLP